MTMTASQNPSPSPENQEASSSSTIDSHLDNPALDQIAGIDEVAVAVEGEVIKPEFITLEKGEFSHLLAEIIGFPNFIMAFKGEPPLKTLDVSPRDPAFLKVSDTIYDICDDKDTPWLKFLIRIEAKWATRGVILSRFAFALAGGVMAEIEDRRRNKVVAND